MASTDAIVAVQPFAGVASAAEASRHRHTFTCGVRAALASDAPATAPALSREHPWVSRILVLPFQRLPKVSGAAKMGQMHQQLKSSHAMPTVRPNPSFKPSPNGMPPGPGHRYGVHCLWPGPGVIPSVPA